MRLQDGDAARGPASTKIAVMGAGSWGTTFAMVLADAAAAGSGADVWLWGRDPRACHEIDTEHRNRTYLGDVELPKNLRACSDAGQVLAGAQVVVLAVPSQTLRDNLAAWRDLLARGAVLVSLMKGVELGTLHRMSEVVAEVAGVPARRVAVVSGPNLAREIAQREPTATVVACPDADVADRLAHFVATPYLRPYVNTDIVGVEIGGALKNVIALAVGIAEGMGFGDNSKATVITRGLAETTRLAVALGADPLTMAGLAGIGDLVATCASPLSRNRTFGLALGRGLSVEQAAAAARQTAEGVKSCGPLLDLARRHQVDLPITEQIVGVVHHGTPLAELGPRLFGRPRKREGE